MSDYVTGLRRDLVEAAERQQHRGRAARAARPLHPQAWSPTALAGAAAVAVALIAVVVTLSTLAPPPKPSDAKIVATIHLGGQPRDAVFAGGSLWIADHEGRVVQLDPATRRVRARIPVGGTPVSVTAAGGAVWVLSTDDDSAGSHLYKFDARSGERLDRVAVGGYGTAIAAGAGGLWLLSDWRQGDLERIDPDSHRRTAFIPDVRSLELAVNGQSVWTLRDEEVVEIDAAFARVVNRVGGISSIDAFASARTLLPDREGAWAVDGSGGRLVRVEGGRVVRSIPVGVTAGVVGRGGSAIWVTVTRGPTRTNQLVRVDLDDERVGQRLAFGYRAPQTLVPVGKNLWVITSGGEAMLVSPG
jgi:DNA-binding beta-propeller fold protein YncE